MCWIGLTDSENTWFDPRGLNADNHARPKIDEGANGLLARGSIVVETKVPSTQKLQPLLVYNQGGEWPLHLAFHAIPGGGLSLVLDQGGVPLHQSVSHSETGRTDTLRVTYAWDAVQRWGQLTVERPQDDCVLTVSVKCPRPIRVEDARAILSRGANRYISPEVEYIALSTEVEPVGPMPSLALDTPVATPEGYVRLCQLRRGDLVVSRENKSVPVLGVVRRTVPASGSFRTLRIRAPFFGLWRDIDVSQSQKLLLEGSEVEYMFGRPAVLLPTRHLVGTPRVYYPDCAPLVTYAQVILPDHEVLDTAGTFAESLFIGRLRRNSTDWERSLVTGIPRHALPEHPRPVEPVLRAFDATVLAERSVA